MTFRDFLVRKLPCIPGELPTLNDRENHLTTIFPKVHLKSYLEMRGADGGLWRGSCNLSALWVCYTRRSHSRANWTFEER
ncbi:hypothetical protein V6N13_122328 [Hibiscus sabdariffa]